MKISANDWLLKLKIKGLGVICTVWISFLHSSASVGQKTDSDMEFIHSRCYN